jgi:ankyrin repeat protein
MKPTLAAQLKTYKLPYLENINESTDNKGHTLLMHAAYRNYYDLAKILLLSGADVLIRDLDGHLALDHAKYMNNNLVYDLLLTKTIQTLLRQENFEFKGVVNLPINDKNETFLTYCAINNKYFLAKLLIEYGASKDIIDDSGKRPLDYAYYFYKILNDEQYKEIFELLKN